MKPADPPLAFSCKAESYEAAETLCEIAHPKAVIAWVYEGADVSEAYQDYWNGGRIIAGDRRTLL